MKRNWNKKRGRMGSICSGNGVRRSWKRAYIRQQPPEVYRLLSSYVGACGMMLQRKILLATGWEPGPLFSGEENT